MAELADALDSGSSGGDFVQVQVLLPAPKQDGHLWGVRFYFGGDRLVEPAQRAGVGGRQRLPFCEANDGRCPSRQTCRFALRNLFNLSCYPHHKETIILIRKISVLWLFYCQNSGILPFFIEFIAKMQACWDGFRPCKLFLFSTVKYKSFTLCPFRLIYGISFNL